MNALQNKVAVVTGGSSGIGRAIALRFAKEGAKVVIIGRKEQALKDVCAKDKNITYLAGDITDSKVIDEIFDLVNTKFAGKLDILVNNA